MQSFVKYVLIGAMVWFRVPLRAEDRIVKKNSFEIQRIEAENSKPFYTYMIPYPWTIMNTKATFRVKVSEPGFCLAETKIRVTRRRPNKEEIEIVRAAHADYSEKWLRALHAKDIAGGYLKPDSEWYSEWDILKSMWVENVEIIPEFKACDQKKDSFSDSVSYQTGHWGQNMVNYQLGEKSVFLHWRREK